MSPWSFNLSLEFTTLPKINLKWAENSGELANCENYHPMATAITLSEILEIKSCQQTSLAILNSITFCMEINLDPERDRDTRFDLTKSGIIG